MKKNLLIMGFIGLVSLFSNQVKAQEKWGFVFAMYLENNGVNGGKTKIYVCDDVIDLTKLDCSLISKKNKFGTEKSKVDFYTECLTEWFKKKIKDYNLNEKYLTFSAVVKDYSKQYGCTYDNEQACFYQTKSSCLENYDKRIAQWKKDKENGAFLAGLYIVN